jgi:nucleoside-diphosphate-sugar epimerase
MNNKKILIFGATGQIGKELSFEFKDTKNINVISHSRTRVGASFFKKNSINNIVGNLTDKEIIDEISTADLIFDLAAPDHGTLLEIKDFYKKRIDILLSNMKKNSKFIFASSMNAFGINEKRKILKNYFFSSSIYTSNKRYAENYIKKIGKEKSIDIFLIRLSEVHGNFQRASSNIKKLIYNNYVFEISKFPAWITFISILKDAIINILDNKEKPDLYTLTCDDIYWSDLIEYFGKQVNIKPKYEIVHNKKDLFKNIMRNIKESLISRKDLIRGNFNIDKNFEELLKLNYRINKAKLESKKLYGVKVYREYNKYYGILPGKRLKSITYDKKFLLK